MPADLLTSAHTHWLVTALIACIETVVGSYYFVCLRSIHNCNLSFHYAWNRGNERYLRAIWDTFLCLTRRSLTPSTLHKYADADIAAQSTSGDGSKQTDLDFTCVIHVYLRAVNSASLFVELHSAVIAGCCVVASSDDSRALHDLPPHCEHSLLFLPVEHDSLR